MTELSPAAQAVLAAIHAAPDDTRDSHRSAGAAALRAAADQVIEEVSPVEELLVIAAELEGAQADQPTKLNLYQHGASEEN